MATQRVESGLRNYRIDFAREDAFAEIPENPEFLQYSGVIQEFNWEVDDTVNERRGLGSADPKSFQKAQEEHEIEIVYDLNRWFTEGGEPLDAAYDAIVRDSDNLLPASHLIVTREDKGAITVDSTVSGETSRPTRIYSVAHGALPEEVEIIGEADETTVAVVEMSYLAHKARSYQIDQPDNDLLCVSSDSAEDTTQEITLENEAGDVSETLTLDGETLVSTSDTYADLDAVELSDECVGNVTVYVNTGDEATPEQGDALMEIQGSSAYDDMEGDLGVPSVGSGSRETEDDLPETFEHFVGDAISRGGVDVPHAISSATLIVENDIEEIELAENIGMALFPGNRELTMEANIFGENASHDSLVDALTTEHEDTIWHLQGGDLVLEDSVLAEPGERALEEGEAVMMVENVFRGKGIDITES